MSTLLTVTYTPNYSGCHRIYFSRAESGPFCLYLDDTLSVIGTEKEVVIDLEDYAECLGTLPSPQGCTSERVYGYVQPCCTEDDPSPSSEYIALFDTTPCPAYSVKCTKPAGCGSFTKVTCDGTPDPVTYQYAYNPIGKVILCALEAPQNTPGSSYTIELSPDQTLCCSCINTTVSTNDPLKQFFIYYYDCKGQSTTSVKATFAPQTLCAAIGSVAAVNASDQADLVISLGAYCN